MIDESLPKYDGPRLEILLDGQQSVSEDIRFQIAKKIFKPKANIQISTIRTFYFQQHVNQFNLQT